LKAGISLAIESVGADPPDTAMQWVACGLSNTIRGAISKCAKKLTQVSLIYRTNQQLKSGKQKKPKKYKTDMLRSTDKQSGESVVSRERRKGTLR